MVQARIEPSPAEQLRELRKARDRYAALAEQLHDSADPQLNPDEKLARELNARRILRSYEKSISNSVVRMSSMDKTHRFARPSLSMRTWLVIFVAISVLEGGMLLAYFRPEIFRLLLPQKNTAKVERIAAAPATPIKTAPSVPAIAAPIVQPAPPETPKPVIRPPAPPVAAAPKPTPQPAPKLIAAPLPLAAAPKLAAPPQLELIAPPPIDAPPMPVIVLEPPPAAQSAPQPVATAPITPTPAAAPQTPPPVATAQPASPPPVAAPAPPQQLASRAAVLTRPEAIAATHTSPPYPNEAKRLGQAGTTRMRLAISPQGAASACEIVKSAGSDQLDAAACSYVQRFWRWKAATQDGQPVTASTEVTIVWNLLGTR